MTGHLRAIANDTAALVWVLRRTFTDWLRDRTRPTPPDVLDGPRVYCDDGSADR